MDKRANMYDNRWDREAASYSIMTLMEVNVTNRQLGCVPLDREDVVLDCGCGPGFPGFRIWWTRNASGKMWTAI